MFSHRIESDGTLYVTLGGAIEDRDTSEFKENLQRLLVLDFHEVVFDLSQVTFICSACIGRMLLFYKTLRSMGRHMRVKGITDYLYSLFEFIHMDLLFPIER